MYNPEILLLTVLFHIKIHGLPTNTYTNVYYDRIGFGVTILKCFEEEGKKNPEGEGEERREEQALTNLPGRLGKSGEMDKGMQRKGVPCTLQLGSNCGPHTAKQATKGQEFPATTPLARPSQVGGQSSSGHLPSGGGR